MFILAIVSSSNDRMSSGLTKQTLVVIQPHLGKLGKHTLIPTSPYPNGAPLYCPFLLLCTCVNTLRPRQNGGHFADDTFKCIFMNEDVRISINISLKFVPRVRINNIPALVHIMAWCRPGDKPLSEPMIISLPTHICAAQPQWVKHEGWLEISQHLWPTIGRCWFILYLVIGDSHKSIT